MVLPYTQTGSRVGTAELGPFRGAGQHLIYYEEERTELK